MERRTKLLIIIVIGLVLLALGIWYLLMPIIRPGLPPQPQIPNQGTGQQGVVPIKKPAVLPPTATVSQEVKMLSDQAGIVVSRVGSGSSGDGFRGYEDVLINATPSYQVALKQERAAMRKAHPATGPAFGITTRSVAVDDRAAVNGAATQTFTVQAQQAEDAGDPTHPTRVIYKQIEVTFAKQADGKYLLDGMVWSDYTP